MNKINKMTKYQLYVPAKSNKLQAPRLGYDHARQWRAEKGYDQVDVINTLENTDLSLFRLRWCEMDFITPNDTWLDRCLLKDNTCEDIGILLIMKEGKSIHPNCIKIKKQHLKKDYVSDNQLYKVALYNRKSGKIMFISVVKEKLNTLTEERDGCFKTNADGWYQLRTKTCKFQIPAADITFWHELKKILC